MDLGNIYLEKSKLMLFREVIFLKSLLKDFNVLSVIVEDQPIYLEYCKHFFGAQIYYPPEESSNL